MNGKKAKTLRRKSKSLACQLIKDRILPPELTEKETCDSLMVALPERAPYWKGFTRHLGVGSKKWFIRQVKKNPELTYDNVLEMMYHAAK